MDIGVAEIREWHRERGFQDVGYNYIIRRDGSVEDGRIEGATLAHAYGFNKNSIAICLVGGVNEFNAPEANFTGEQGATLRGFLSWMERKYPNAKVCGHRDLPGVAKDRPSLSVSDWRATGHFIKPKKEKAV